MLMLNKHDVAVIDPAQSCSSVKCMHGLCGSPSHFVLRRFAVWCADTCPTALLCCVAVRSRYARQPQHKSTALQRNHIYVTVRLCT